MRRFLVVLPIVAVLAVVGIERLGGVPAGPACEADNGALKLPAGFCAAVVAEGVATARHIVVAENGDLFVALRGGRGGSGGVAALRDTNGDGKMDVTERFGDKSTNGIALRNGYLYIGTTTTVERFKLAPGELKPAGAAEVIVQGLPEARPHQDKGIAFDGRGSLYLNVGAPSNTCQNPDRRAGAPGQDPCPLLEKHGGIWKFDENKPGQTQESGQRYATGLRQMPGITWYDGALYIAMNGRDQLDQHWPDKFTAQDNDTRPSESLFRVNNAGEDFGWPYCFHDFIQNKLLLNPDYGGDGKEVGRCAKYPAPIATFPPHWAPVDLMFYTASNFPARYKGGAFIAFHGSWNRTAGPQNGYTVVFQPFASGKPSGKFEVFADGFEGAAPPKTQAQAVYRPTGVAQGPDGHLYITDDVKGRIWRVMYNGSK